MTQEIKQLIFILTFSLSLPLFAAEKSIIFVSILPQKFFVEQIVGDTADVRVMVEPGQVPETYEPSQKKMAALSRAKLFFRVGLSFEESLLNSFPSALIIEPPQEHEQVVSIANLESMKSQSENHSEHREHEQLGHEKNSHEQHSHDPHIWLDPILVKQQMEIIYANLAKVFPTKKLFFKNNLEKFNEKLQAMHNHLKRLLSRGKQNHFLIFHPALGHFAERYHLEQVSIEKNGKIPSAKYLSQLLIGLSRESVQYILVEQQFSQKEARTIGKEIGAKLLTIDPLAYSYFDNMQDIAAKVKRALY